MKQLEACIISAVYYQPVTFWLQLPGAGRTVIPEGLELALILGQNSFAQCTEQVLANPLLNQGDLRQPVEPQIEHTHSVMRIVKGLVAKLGNDVGAAQPCLLSTQFTLSDYCFSAAHVIFIS